MNRPNFNQNLRVTEFQGSARDGDAVVNQYGIHNHGAGVKNNAIELGADVATMIGGPVGVVANGANAIRHAFKGNWGNALKSVGKGVASMIPGLNLLVGGASALKNGSDIMTHGGGMIEQGMKGGYSRQTQLAQQMMGGNMAGGLGQFYGGNYANYQMYSGGSGIGSW